MSHAWKGAQPSIQPRVNEDNKIYMLQCVIRLPELFLLAKDELKPDNFDALSEPHLIVLWRAMLRVASANNNSIPQPASKAKALVELETTKLVDAAPSHLVAGGSLEQLFGENGLISEIFLGRNDDELDFNTAVTLLESFLKERVVIDPLQRFVDKLGASTVPADIDTILSNAKSSLDRISSLTTSPVQEVVPLTWETNAIAQVPTNISFLDAAMDGGPALGEVIVLLGPTGGGKTLIGLMLAVNGARYQVQQQKDNKPSGYWYYFTYESPVTPDIRRRVMSYAAEIHHNLTMKYLTHPNMLSTSGNLKHYEEERWAEQIKAGLQIPGELERYNAAVAALGGRLKLVDMSGSPPNPSVGTKGIDEIVRVLQDGLAKTQTPIGIVIDYAGIMVERYMAAHNEKVENEFHHLNRFVNNVRVQIASRFNCISWVLHQLHGDSAAASPTTRQHHSRARGARNFADNANFAFNLGTKDTGTNCCIITCTKARRADSVKDPPIVRIDGAFGMMVPEDQRYTLDQNSRKIVSREVDRAYSNNGKETGKPLLSHRETDNA